MTIYLDVLLFINFYVAYFEILAVCVFTHSDIPFVRRITGSAIGAIFSLAVFIPDNLYLLSAFLKIAACFIVTLPVFGFGSIKKYLKYSFYMMFVSFIFAGICLATQLWLKPVGMLCKNGTLYLDLDVFTLVAAVAIAYFTVRLIRYILDKNSKTDRKYIVTVHNLGNTCTLTGLSDSGNSAVDYFSGMPIIVCKKDSLLDILPPMLVRLMSKDGDLTDVTSFNGVRILPFSTVSGDGLLYTFKVDSITIKETGEKHGHRVNALIGISTESRQSYDAIFNPKLLL